MTDDDERSPWAPPGDSGSSLPPPVPTAPPSGFPSEPPVAPPPSIDAPPVAPDTPLDMTFVEPDDEGSKGIGGRWFGRGLAAAGAAVLIGGGGYLALGAGTDDGGADSPQAAVEELFAALSAEDLVGAAELVEPSERDTLVAAGFDIADELVRLEVLADDLDLGSLSGLDLEFDDLVLRTDQVSPDVANVAIEGGIYTASYEADELPVGPLVLDRVPEDWLTTADSVSEPMVDPNIIGLGRDAAAKITTVQRDGRWYVSLWYSVAENARSFADAPFPDPGRRLVPIGSNSPEAAVRRLVDEAQRLDLRQVLRLLDPEEARALHDYASLFLDDVEDAADEVLRGADRDGVVWDVHTLELHADTRGDRATVIFDEIGFTLESEELSLVFDASADSLVLEVDEVLWDGESRTTSVVVEDGCTTATWEDEYDNSTDTMCADDMFDEFGLSSSILANTAGGVLTPTTGIETHRVDGEWYISPTASVTQPMLSVMRSWEPEDLAGLVDALVDFARDPFDENDFSFGTSEDFTFEPVEVVPEVPFDTVPPLEIEPVIPELVPTTTFAPGEDPLLYLPENADLLDPSIDFDFWYDLWQDDADYEFDIWVPGSVAPLVERGFYAETAGARGTVVVIVVDTGDEAAAAAALAGIGEIEGTVARELAGVGFLQAADSYGDPVLVAADGTELVVIGMFGATLAEQEAVLIRQLTG